MQKARSYPRGLAGYDTHRLVRRPQAGVTMEYYTETAITIDWTEPGKGKARIDSSHTPTKNKLERLGAKEVTDQPPGAPYRSFEVPANWIRIQKPREISEEERAVKRQRFIKTRADMEKRDQEGAS